MGKTIKHLQLSNSSRRFLVNIRFLAVVAIILWIASHQIVDTGKYAVSSLHLIVENLHLSYDAKMRARRGGWTNVAEFARKNTPSTAVVIYPPFGQENWEYFLYPRKLLSGSRRSPAVHESATHVLVMHDWPKFPLNMRRFLHLSPTRKIMVHELGVSSSPAGIDSKLSRENMKQPPQLLENYISDAEKKVEHHQRTKVGNRLVEFIQVTYIFSNHDYWMRAMDLPLSERTVVKTEIRANIKHILNLVAEIRYDNDKLAIFGSSPNKEVETWEVLSITDPYQMAKEYALARGWSVEKMRITRIGINAGLSREMPYLEKYGVIELERGQPGIEENADPEIDNAPYFFKMANYYGAKNQFEKATKYYQLAEKLNPANAWIHSSLGDIYLKMGDYTGAVEEYEKAIQLEPDIGWFYFTLGRVYEKEGKVDLARKSYEKALRIDPSGIWADHALKNLGEGKR